MSNRRISLLTEIPISDKKNRYTVKISFFPTILGRNFTMFEVYICLIVLTAFFIPLTESVSPK